MGAPAADTPMHESSWREKLDEAKRKHRPRLKDWGRDQFATRRASDFERLADLTEHPGTALRTVARVRRRDLGRRQFWEHYEKLDIPLIIQDIPEEEGWPAVERWTFRDVGVDHGNVKVKCGEDDEGYSVKVRVRHFLEYVRHQQDDSPLYVFDSRYDEHSTAKQLLADYSVPSYFPDDLFELVGEKRRPPYRWFLIGPKRSGTSVHIDPLGTSAWNTVLVGRKRWVLFPPSTDKAVAKGKTVIRPGEDDEPVNFFVDHLPRIRQLPGGPEVYEFIQYPGETVFIPGGWWHAVLNLDDTIAVTQNFCSRINFDQVWRKTRTGRKKMAVKWLSRLQESHPDLAQRALDMNSADGFVMPERSHHRKEHKHSKKKSKDRKHKDVEERHQHKRAQEQGSVSSTYTHSSSSSHKKQRVECSPTPHYVQ